MTAALRHVVVGIDFTECSRNALRQAIRLAGLTGATVRVVHVIDTLVVVDLQRSAEPRQQAIHAGLEREARAAWTQFAASVDGAAGLPFEVLVNNRVAGLLGAVTGGEADLLVLGAFGDRKPDVGIGTVASGCVRRSPVDVLLIRDTQPAAFKTIVCAVDFSEASRAALERAARLAAVDGAALHVLNVFDPPWNKLPVMAAPDLTLPDPAEIRAGIEKRLAEFGDVAQRAAPGVAVTTVCYETSSHRSGINAYAAESSADLVVLGTRGRANLRDMLLGSTAEKTLQGSRCSVLAVVPHAHS